jgi:hypothetical protein
MMAATLPTWDGLERVLPGGNPADVRFASLFGPVLLIAVGGVWVFQGIGSLKGSFMTGSPFWAWVGIVCVAGGVGLLVRAIRRG